MSIVVPVTDATYRARVVDSPAPVLLAFLENGTAARRAFAPVLADAAAQLGDDVLVATVEVTGNPETVRRWGVTATPTLVLLLGNRVERVLKGVRPAARLVEEVREALRST
jgi:thioredoxin 1